ncbi:MULTISPECIES: sigma-70 family RNA polymerase sigma factor [Bacillus cereus group]|uniref:sigma-70 family RNA polymerase sigma factor n=1 Tax=Bacillus cereus group TaxID=86661 RepID=UPI00077225A3|nr:MULTISPECIES: sigma-70 family RNA polymerase sigma factor [Bacillus cereus group]KXI45656.1 RNA polymerase subunit sigma-70 [Bacillus cereus]MDA2770459.1 sigma-70 family RNA polymerase sigma factor [Bacillus cereus group sp. Bc010]MED1444458.1 sigma-70 family RNA polymerase sigma factor [Bacillus pacificus]
MREVEIVEGLRKKDMKALHAAIDQYGDLIYKVVHGVLDTSHSKVLVDECVDDILLIIWYNIDSYDEKRGKFRNWLISIAKFKAIDFKRKSNQVYRLQEFQQDIYEERTVTNQTKEEEEENFYLLIRSLNNEDKKIFIKRYLDEYSVQEIASELGLATDTVYSRLSRGRKKIKKIIGGETDAQRGTVAGFK